MAKSGWGTTSNHCQRESNQVQDEGLQTLISGELDLGILEELRTKNVGQSVIFLVEGEERGVGSAY